MAKVYFDSKYCPCGFLIVKTGCDPYDDKNTIAIQSDWDFPGVAASMGWTPCDKCERTDGTVDCEHHTKSEMISAAYDFIEAHEGEEFRALDDYFPAREEICHP